MKTCTFFGHKDTSYIIKPKVECAIENLIVNENVKKFYVGNQGNFAFMVQSILEKMKTKYPEINYNIVLAYFPNGDFDYNNADIYPEGLETVPKSLQFPGVTNGCLNNLNLFLPMLLVPVAVQLNLKN